MSSTKNLPPPKKKVFYHFIISFSHLGKFFCIPHSTDYSLEKYRYRRKEDALRDADSKQKEAASTNHEVNHEWSRKDSVLDSLTDRHRQRLMLGNDRRGSTPERYEEKNWLIDGQGGFFVGSVLSYAKQLPIFRGSKKSLDRQTGAECVIGLGTKRSDDRSFLRVYLPCKMSSTSSFFYSYLPYSPPFTHLDIARFHESPPPLLPFPSFKNRMTDEGGEKGCLSTCVRTCW